MNERLIFLYVLCLALSAVMNERLIFLYVLCLILPALVNKRLSFLYLLSSRVFCFLHLLSQHGQRGIQPLIPIRANAVCVKLTQLIGSVPDVIVLPRQKHMKIQHVLVYLENLGHAGFNRAD